MSILETLEAEDLSELSTIALALVAIAQEIRTLRQMQAEGIPSAGRFR